MSNQQATVFRAFDRAEFLEWPAWERLQRILTANGGSYGLSGQRGAGKSWLMLRAIAWVEEPDPTGASGGIGLWYPSPSEYDAHAFIASLSDTFALRIERWYAEEPRVQRKELLWRTLIGLVVLTCLTGVIAVMLTSLSGTFALLISAGIVAAGIAVGAVLQFQRLRWPPHRLLRRARLVSQHARFSITQREATEFGGEGGRGFVGRVRRTRERELSERPATLSSLVNDFRTLAAEAGVVTGRVLIALDELDKMAEPDKVRALLRDIKAIFEIANTHFLVSVSDEAARNLSLGSLTSRNEFSSSFYTVVQALPARPEDCAELLERRSGAPREVSLVLAVLAGGNPREVIRLADLAGDVATGIEAAMAALGEEALALRREIVTAEPVESLEPIGQEVRQRAFLALPDESFEQPQRFVDLCSVAMRDMWDLGHDEPGWERRFGEGWRRLMIRLAVAGELAMSASLVGNPDLTDRMLDVVAAASQSSQVAQIILERRLRIESRRSPTETLDPEEARKEIEKAGRAYEELRARMEPGPARTQAMDGVAARVRRIARDAQFSFEEIRSLLRSSKAGDRVAGLAAVQAIGDSGLFEDVFEIVRSPETPFEQYHALRALESLLGALNEREVEETSSLLRDDAWLAGLEGDTSRIGLAHRMLTALDKSVSVAT